MCIVFKENHTQLQENLWTMHEYHQECLSSKTNNFNFTGNFIYKSKENIYKLKGLLCYKICM